MSGNQMMALIFVNAWFATWIYIAICVERSRVIRDLGPQRDRAVLESLLPMRKRVWYPGDQRDTTGAWIYHEDKDGAVPIWHIKQRIEELEGKRQAEKLGVVANKEGEGKS